MFEILEIDKGLKFEKLRSICVAEFAVFSLNITSFCISSALLLHEIFTILTVSRVQ